MSTAALDQHRLKQQLQRLFRDHLVVVVGAGLSCAEGLPGMPTLARHLRAAIPLLLAPKDRTTWQAIDELLASGTGLERALHDVPCSEDLEQLIISESCRLICPAELDIIKRVISAGHTLRFSRLLPHLVPTGAKEVTVVTTNYDRLIEVAVEGAFWGLDNLFVGRSLGQFDPKTSPNHFVRAISLGPKNAVRKQYYPRVKLLKPHGSLDWFDRSGEPLYCPYDLDLPRMIVTPGVGKYRRGYDKPFDAHREAANHAIDDAAAFLCIGYGFNDDHLQTHLLERIRAGVPTAVVTRTLSGEGQKLVDNAPNTLALTFDQVGGKDGTLVKQSFVSTFFEGLNIWDLGSFINEVFPS